jgi:hypothetical protein
MANIFKNKVAANIGTGGTALYTVPSATTATVIGLSIANTTASNITVDVQITDTSAGVTIFLIENAIITPGSNIVVVGGEQKVVLETTDIVTVTSSVNSSADAILSVLEIS